MRGIVVRRQVGVTKMGTDFKYKPAKARTAAASGALYAIFRKQGREKIPIKSCTKRQHCLYLQNEYKTEVQNYYILQELL